ncbi:gas vesicle protein K [Streptomyces rapamycinicus]|nr:gas vesicle protein K [Streptomyces rapamycinicus]UTO67894.1 gas vesicle protein K [Streptomyces rapamycinicus]UTP37085.1 gas vesicle protein K [Streptomyces rapamycinicus NRRL 5491]
MCARSSLRSTPNTPPRCCSDARLWRKVPTKGDPRMSAPSGAAAQRLRTDADTVERDLAKLVLTVVELLRQLMERQALHRVDKGDLTEEQEERVGMTLMILQQRMEEMCASHDLRLEDLNLDLGPLGTLLSPAGPPAQ